MLRSEYIRYPFLRRFLEAGFGRFIERERGRRMFPWISESLLQKVSFIFLNCPPLRRLVPFVVNMDFFFDRIIEYSTALRNTTIHRGEVLLDIGSGYSFYPSYLASRAYTISLDISLDVMIFQKKASKSMGKPVSQRLECIIADCTMLPFKNGSMDDVFVISTIEHIEKDNTVAKECGRVLKRGGMCAMSFPFSKLARDSQTKPYFQRFYTREAIQERIVIPSQLSLEELFNFRKIIVSFFYSVVPDGWFILKDLAIGLTLSKLEEILLSRNKGGSLSVIKLRKDFEKAKKNL